MNTNSIIWLQNKRIAFLFIFELRAKYWEKKVKKKKKDCNLKVVYYSCHVHRDGGALSFAIDACCVQEYPLRDAQNFDARISRDTGFGQNRMKTRGNSRNNQACRVRKLAPS